MLPMGGRQPGSGSAGPERILVGVHVPTYVCGPYLIHTPLEAPVIRARSRISVLAVAALLPAAAPAQDFDILIRGGQVLDGTGADARQADIGVQDGRIAAMGNLAGARAERVIDASGLLVTPGFIDMHSHADWALGVPEANAALPLVTQGITTIVVGQDGRSAWRVGERMRDVVDVWSRQGLSVNAILLVGHGSVRREVMGDEDRAPTPGELDRMRALVRGAMEDGAWGISTGLGYTPGRYAETEEVIALTREVKPFGGFYISHLRNQGDRLLESVDETIRIGRETGVPVVHTHFKSSGARNWGGAKAAMERIAAAREEGVLAWVDVYPWETSSDGIAIRLLPPAAWEIGAAERADVPLEGRLEELSNEELTGLVLLGNRWIARTTTRSWLAGRPRAELLDLARGALRSAFRPDEVERRAELRRRLADPVLGDSIRAIIRQRLERSRPEIFVIEDAVDDRLDGKTLPEAAEVLGLSLEDVAIEIDLMNARVTSYHMSDIDVDEILRWPFTAISTDGTLDYLGVGDPHPRSYASFPHLLRFYAMEKGVLTMPQAVRAATGVAADIIGLEDRGYLREGHRADIVVLDPQRIGACSTFKQPHCYSEGIEHLLVNGVPTLSDGEHTGARAGWILTPKRDIPTGVTAGGS